MSKMDDLRAMREARYQETVARAAAAAKGTTAAKAPTAATKRAAAAPRAAAPTEPAAAAEATEGLCGHRNMSGRTCTREHGHAAKSHRYS
jgi:hypothetical protein